ncbi:MAG TPA: PIN domain-containing protein [Bryobacterales bacterium]|nr:PIN domain-containing protein [Bryobacterales bacterium]
MSAVADSGALYALYDAGDKHHLAVRAALAGERGDIIVPAAILSEVDYLLREFLGIDAELDFMEALSAGHYRLEPTTSADIDRCRSLIASYRDLDLGLADCAVIATAERLGINRVLTVDERDFRAVRPLTGPFVLLPADA